MKEIFDGKERRELRFRAWLEVFYVAALLETSFKIELPGRT